MTSEEQCPVTGESRPVAETAPTTLEPRHTLVVVLESGSIGARMVCPYEGQTFRLWVAAPECRQVGGDPSGGVAESCHAVECWEEEGEDSLSVPRSAGAAVEVASLPIGVDVRWDATGVFFVTLVAGEGQEMYRRDSLFSETWEPVECTRCRREITDGELILSTTTEYVEDHETWELIVEHRHEVCPPTGDDQ